MSDTPSDPSAASDVPPAPEPPPTSAPPPPPPPAAGEMATGQLGKARSIGLVILLTIVTLGIWTLVWSFQNGDELKRHAGKGVGGIGYLLITFILSPITMFLMASEVEQLYRVEGKDPPITTIWGLWFLLPIIGHIIWYVRIQHAINDYWIAHGWSGKPGL